MDTSLLQTVIFLPREESPYFFSKFNPLNTPPHYYRQFALSLGKEGPYFFSKFNQLNTAPHYYCQSAFSIEKESPYFFSKFNLLNTDILVIQTLGPPQYLCIGFLYTIVDHTPVCPHKPWLRANDVLVPYNECQKSFTKTNVKPKMSFIILIDCNPLHFLLRHVYQLYTSFKFPLLRGFHFDVESLQKQFIRRTVL